MTSTSPAAQSSTGLRRNRILVLITVCLAVFVVIVNELIIVVALPSIRRDLNFDDGTLVWVFNSYSLVFGGFLLVGGRSADLFGRKRILIIGLALFSVGSLLCGLAATSTALLFSRALQGLSAALIAPSALSILTTTFDDGPERRTALAAWTAVGAGSGGVGLLLGGILTELLSWPFIFFLNVPMSIAIAAAVTRWVSDSRSENTGGFDLGGAITATAGLIALAYTIVSGRKDGWGAPTTLGAAVVAILVVGAFLVIQHRHSSPLVRLSVFRVRTLATANAAMFLVASVPLSVFYFMTLHFQESMGYTPIQTGLAFLPAAVAVMIGSQVARKLMSRIDIRFIVAGALTVTALGGALLTRVNADGHDVYAVLPTMALIFVGVGCALVALTVLATTKVPSSDAGLASGLLNTTKQVGGALGLAVLSSMVSSRSVSSSSPHTEDGLGSRDPISFWGVALLAAISAVVVVTFLRHRHVDGLRVGHPL